MKTRNDLCDWLIAALEAQNGSASIIDVCKYVWLNHEDDLKNAGDLFYSWQYDIRWAATQLRSKGLLKDVSLSPKGIWEIA
jgi:hypothetical protein